MNIDPLPLTALALESWGLAARGSGKTLTLQLALSAVPSPHPPMSGRASANQSFGHCADVLRAAVVPADGRPLTITF